MKQLEGIEGWLWDITRGNQPKSAVEGLIHNSLFFENIGERPVRHHLGQSIALAYGVGDPRSHVERIGDGRLVLITGVVLGPDQRKVRHGRRPNLIANFYYSTANHLVARNFFIYGKNVFRFVVAVDV